MLLRSTAFSVIAVILLTAPALAQQAVRQQAPPEIRALVDSVIKAVNSGSADAWEAFAQERYAPALLKAQTPAQRAEEYRRIADRFGTAALNGVRREGPDAPLQLMIKGSNGAGAIVLDIDGAAAPRIISLTVEGGGADAPVQPPADGVPPPPVNGSMASDAIDRNLDGYFSKLAAGEVFSGVALVARNGVPVFFKAYGMADREKKVANTIRTRFNLGSINKEFTQTAIRQLVSAGKLSLTDTLGKFYPDYPQAASRAATVEQLMTHRGGLSDFFGSAFNTAPKDRFASNADYFAFVGGLPPAFAPGERNQYCNGCYIALGAIVEKASGMPYEKYVAENVFGRAEMTSTGYPRSDRPSPDIAIGYTRLRQGYGGQARGGVSQDLKTSGPQDLVRNTAMHGVTGSAAGGGYSTALDLLTYAKAVRAGRFPGEDPEMGIAGGAPGINAILESRGEWTVIVLTNFDPPLAQRVGVALADALSR